MQRIRRAAFLVGSVALLAGEAVAADKPPEQIFRANCSTCHGSLGEGGTSWIDPSQNGFNIAGRSKASIKKWVREGRPPEMPMFGVQEINNTELEALATYVNGLPGSFIAPPVAQHQVTIQDNDPWYFPMQLQVALGDTVQYTNLGDTYHPVTQIDYVATRGASGTDSGMLGPNGTYFRQFTTTGKHTFLCKIHPYMRGEVWVNQAPVAPSHSHITPMGLPPVPGVGEVWLLAQFQDYPGKTADGVIQVINAANWQVTHTIPAGNNPHNLMFTPDNSTAFFTNWFANTLTAVDANTKTVGQSYIMGASPAHIMNAMGSNTFFVTIEGSRYVQTFDATRLRRTTMGTVSGQGPHGNWVAGGKVMTSNSLDSTVSFLTESRLTEINSLSADLYPLGASMNSMGTRGYAGNCLSGTVSIYNTQGTPSKITDLYIGGCPVQVPVTPDDAYVVAANSPYTTIISTATNSVVAQLVTGYGAHGVAFGPKQGGGWYAYVSHKYENFVAVIDLATFTHVGDIPLVTTTTNKVSITGYTDTGGNGITTRF